MCCFSFLFSFLVGLCFFCFCFCFSFCVCFCFCLPIPSSIAGRFWRPGLVLLLFLRNPAFASSEPSIRSARFFFSPSSDLRVRCTRTVTFFVSCLFNLVTIPTSHLRPFDHSTTQPFNHSPIRSLSRRRRPPRSLPLSSPKTNVQRVLGTKSWPWSQKMEPLNICRRWLNPTCAAAERFLHHRVWILSRLIHAREPDNRPRDRHRALRTLRTTNRNHGHNPIRVRAPRCLQHRKARPKTAHGCPCRFGLARRSRIQTMTGELEGPSRALLLPLSHHIPIQIRLSGIPTITITTGPTTERPRLPVEVCAFQCRLPG